MHQDKTVLPAISHVSILKKPQGIASFVFLRNLHKGFHSRVNPVQGQISDHTLAIKKHQIPECGLRGDGLCMEGTSEPRGMGEFWCYLPKCKAAVCGMFLCTSMCSWISKPRSLDNPAQVYSWQTKKTARSLLEHFPVPGGVYPLHGCC